jgi:hypothetical protein
MKNKKLFNRVPENVRKVFFQNFPEFAEAWNINKENKNEY